MISDLLKINPFPRTSVSFSNSDVDVQVLNIKAIDGGIEVQARAWNTGGQIGFGDGTVDIERFKIINPPTVIPDPNGKIIVTSTDIETGEIKTSRYTEDPKAALLQVLAHTIKVKTEKSSAAGIINDKIGSTTTTVFPDPSTETTTVDGYVQFEAGTFAAARAGTAGDDTSDTNASILCATTNAAGGTIFNIGRSFTLFDTSSIPDTDTISSAVYSLYRNDLIYSFQNADTTSVHCVATTPASNTAIVLEDYDQVGTTSFGSFLMGDTAVATYEDITLNASGLAAISKTGVTKLGVRNSLDFNNISPTGTNRISFASADAAGGTSTAPKLVIEHAGAAAPSTTPIPTLLTMRVG